MTRIVLGNLLELRGFFNIDIESNVFTCKNLKVLYTKFKVHLFILIIHK